MKLRVFLLCVLIVAVEVTARSATTDNNAIDRSFSPDQRSLFLVIEVSTATQDLLRELSRGFSSILSAANNGRNWLTSYVIHATIADSTVLKSERYSDVDSVSAALLKLSSYSGLTAPTSCDRPLIRMISDTFAANANNIDGSEVLLITSGSENQADLSVLYKIVSHTVQTPKIDYIHVENSACNATAGHRLFDQLISSSKGIRIRMTAADVTEALKVVLPSRRSSEPLGITPNTDACSIQFTVTMEPGMDKLYVLLGGSTVAVVLKDVSSNANVGPSSQYRSSSQGIWMFQPKTGTYTVTVFSNNPLCFPSFYATGAKRVFMGFAPSSDMDLSLPTMIKDSSNYAVFHLLDADGNAVPQASLTNAAVDRYSLSGSGSKVESYYYVLHRDGFSFEYFIDNMFKCQEDDTFTVTLTGKDSTGATFYRSLTAWCIVSGGVTNTNPQTQPRQYSNRLLQ